MARDWVKVVYERGNILIQKSGSYYGIFVDGRTETDLVLHHTQFKALRNAINETEEHHG